MATPQVSQTTPVALGVIGAGNMGGALVEGWVRSPLPGLKLIVWDKVEAAGRRLLTSDMVSLAGSLEALVSGSDVVFVVVKPKDAGEVLGLLAGRLRSDQVVVSAMAGPTLEWMRGVIGPGPALIRIMPNLGVSLRVGALAMAADPFTDAATAQTVTRLLEPLGMVEPVPEDALDAVTAVSGSGPAFLALVLESLEDGAVAAGLPRATARALVRQAALDTARLLPLHADSPAGLRAHLDATGDLDRSAVAVLDDNEVRLAFQRAVEAAMERSRSLRAAVH
ncbi:MAG: NAD(P)-binding domain-containing protein [Thermoleophilia bacterium]|nr:NAD(P)-binding domain-containing protein [Thermoleophilia bacterium]